MSKPVNRREIIIGDVHGCVDELNALINKVNYCSEKDSLYFLGDIINRGPFSKKTYDRIKELNAVSILGNHELTVLKRAQDNPNHPKLLKLKEEFGPFFQEFLNDLVQWPVFIETDKFILIHGGLIPGKSLQEMEPEIVTFIRTWDGSGADLKNPANPPWFELYKGKKLVVFGHWAALKGVQRDNVIGIDTGCVYGRELTALLLPDQELVSVKANKVYHPIHK